MKVIKLEIRKHDQFNDDYRDEIVGKVQIAGETGKMEVRLHPNTVIKIFRLCKEDVQRTANANAAQAGYACENIAGSVELGIENEDLKQLED